MATTSPATCVNHRSRERLASCGTCGNALCRDCIVHTPVGIKCRTCTGEAAAKPSKGAGAAKPPTGPGRRGGSKPTEPRSRPRWLVPGAIAAVVVLVGVVLVARSGGGGHKVVDNLPNSDPNKTADFQTEYKVSLTGGSGTHIGGFFDVPAQQKAVVGGALIIPGFGTIDHDAVMATTTPDGSADRLSQELNYSRPGTPDNLYRDLNDVLLADGIATMRYDKRGSATSHLDDSQALSYDDLVADARAAFALLAQRKETAGKPLAIVGVDQGGLVAMRLASDPRVKAVALVSTFARPLADVIGGDLVAARGDPDGTNQSAQVHAVAAALAAGQPVPAQADLIANLRPLFRPNQEQYLRQIFGLDPVAEARNIKVPTLLVRGAKDTTVTAADSALLLPALPSGSTEIVVPDGDHNLGVKTVRDPTMLANVASWIASHTRG